MNVELEFLVARRRWPVASTRWWAMQELALLLLLPEHQTEVSTRLVGELSACHLESEAVEVLFIFWLAFNQGWSPRPDLGAAVLRTSMLTDHLLADIGLASPASVVPPLAAAPTEFQVPVDFERRQGRDVPRIYYTVVANLERRWGLPLLRQLAYEWTLSETVYPDAPFQGDLSYFVRPAGDYAAGGFANRTCLRVLTAFIRTMEVARSVWGVPYDLVFWAACKALPLEPSLAFLRPARPTWLPALRLDVAADTASVAGFIVDARVELEAMDPDAALLALTTPLHVSNNEFVELTAVRWRRWGSAPVDAASVWQRFQRRQHRDFGRLSSEDIGLKSRIPSLSLAEVIDNDAQAAPMAALHDVGRIGYLQRDLYPERIYLPVLTGVSDDLVVEPSGGELSISAVGQAVATLAYWNAGWSPGHPSRTSGLTGTALVGRLKVPLVTGEEAPAGHFLLWKVTRLKRVNGYGPYTEEEPVYGVVEL